MEQILRKETQVEECPHIRRKYADYPALCEHNGKFCLLESGLPCETYEEWLKEE